MLRIKRSTQNKPTQQQIYVRFDRQARLYLGILNKRIKKFIRLNGELKS
jgi:hypothetical protein